MGSTPTLRLLLEPLKHFYLYLRLCLDLDAYRGQPGGVRRYRLCCFFPPSWSAKASAGRMKEAASKVQSLQLRPRNMECFILIESEYPFGALRLT
jgi:hypothetical protein